MPVPSHNQDFKIHMSCFFVFSELRGFVRFVDIGGIAEHYCLILGGPECFSIGVSRITKHRLPVVFK
jgi:hypothetical protein